MIVIADTSPLNYAVQIGAAPAFFRLYGRIVLPEAVYSELTGPGAPNELRLWMQQFREQFEIRPVVLPPDPHLAGLHPGEAQAIYLAQQTPNSLLIIDERDGRAEARRRSLAFTGLLGVLRDAASRGYLDFEEALRKPKATDFRLSKRVEDTVREQYRKGLRTQ